MRYIVLGKTELKEELFNTDLTDNGINKPKGGLWSSPYNKDTISGENSMKEENIRVNYKTIDIVEQRGLLEITRDLGKLLTKEEFDEIMMVYEKVTDRLLAEVEKQGMDI